jgi:hypothetical protein
MRRDERHSSSENSGPIPDCNFCNTACLHSITLAPRQYSFHQTIPNNQAGKPNLPVTGLLRRFAIPVDAKPTIVESSPHTVCPYRSERSHLPVSTIATTWRIRSAGAGSTDRLRRCGESSRSMDAMAELMQGPVTSEQMEAAHYLALAGAARLARVESAGDGY